MASTGRPLAIDESLSHRLAGRLRERGREARSWKDLGLKGLNDPQVIRDVHAKLGPEAVVVTGDDHMPEDHADVIAELRATIAVVAPYNPRRRAWQAQAISPEEAWKREIVARWAHAMQTQERGSVRRYSLNGGSVWKPVRR